MGIKGFGVFLKKRCPEVYKVIPLSDLKIKSIAIDANNWMCVNMHFASTKTVKSTDVESGENIDRFELIKNWIDSCIHFIEIWLQEDIVPIFVFDGKYPEEKKNTQTDRKDQREIKAKEITKLKYLITSDNVAEEDTDIQSLIDSDIEKKAMILRLRKLMSNDASVNRDDTKTLKRVLTSLGMPVIEAPGEAEKHCAYLNSCGYADAIFSGDSDVFAFGGLRVLNKTMGRDEFGNTLVQSIELKDILKNLDIKYSTFIDICIMSGCDYNTNIPNTGIGKAYQLLKTFGSLENLERNRLDLDTKCLKTDICRRLFLQEEFPVEQDKLVLNPDLFRNKARSTLEELELVYRLPRLCNLILKRNSLN